MKTDQLNIFWNIEIISIFSNDKCFQPPKFVRELKLCCDSKTIYRDKWYSQIRSIIKTDICLN